jgi:hypothetical protein
MTEEITHAPVPPLSVKWDSVSRTAAPTAGVPQAMPPLHNLAPRSVQAPCPSNDASVTTRLPAISHALNAHQHAFIKPWPTPLPICGLVQDAKPKPADATPPMKTRRGRPSRTQNLRHSNSSSAPKVLAPLAPSPAPNPNRSPELTSGKFHKSQEGRLWSRRVPGAGSPVRNPPEEERGRKRARLSADESTAGSYIHQPAASIVPSNHSATFLIRDENNNIKTKCKAEADHTPVTAPQDSDLRAHHANTDAQISPAQPRRLADMPSEKSQQP